MFFPGSPQTMNDASRYRQPFLGSLIIARATLQIFMLKFYGPVFLLQPFSIWLTSAIIVIQVIIQVLETLPLKELAFQLLNEPSYCLSHLLIIQVLETLPLLELAVQLFNEASYCLSVLLFHFSCSKFPNVILIALQFQEIEP